MAILTRIEIPRFRIGLTKAAIGFTAVLMVLLICGIPGTPAADDLPEISSVNPMPEIEELPYFDNRGYIDDISSNSIIVDDILIDNEEGITPEYIRASDRTKLTRSNFQKGDYVGVQRTGAMGLKRLWKLEKP